jgi:ethanolamine utilization protein EutP (predicted NTPase)
MAAEVPGFAGIYVDEGTIVIMAKRDTREDRAIEAVQQYLHRYNRNENRSVSL